MALRTVGTPLTARANYGTAYRKIQEQNIATPQIRSRGELGTVMRNSIEEPLVRQTAIGSDKIVSAQPTIEGMVNPTTDLNTVVPPVVPVAPVAPVAPLPDGIGLTTNPVVPDQANNQALFQGNNQSSNQPAPRPQGRTTASPIGLTVQGGSLSSNTNRPLSLPPSRSNTSNPTQPATNKLSGNTLLTSAASGGGILGGLKGKLEGAAKNIQSSGLGRLASLALPLVGRIAEKAPQTGFGLELQNFLKNQFNKNTNSGKRRIF